jgi:CheY-like chemotaxis protein
MAPIWIRTELFDQISRGPAGPNDESGRDDSPEEGVRFEENGDPSEDVLLVEDDIDAAQMYAMGLRLSGHPARVATNGRSALDDVAHKQPRAIVLDLRLPDIGGLEVIDSLRHAPATLHVPIIVLSNEDSQFPEAVRRGANECHIKYRTTPNELVHYVEGAIGGAA